MFRTVTTTILRIEHERSLAATTGAAFKQHARPRPRATLRRNIFETMSHKFHSAPVEEIRATLAPHQLAALRK